MRIWIILMAISLLASCTKERPEPPAEQPITKKIEFHLHAAKDYSDSRYDGTTAEVRMGIYKINYGSGASQLLWDTVFTTRSIRLYPVLPEKFAIEKLVPVLESREKIQANYNIIYRQKELIMQENFADECVPGETFTFLDVGI